MEALITICTFLIFINGICKQEMIARSLRLTYVGLIIKPNGQYVLFRLFTESCLFIMDKLYILHYITIK